MIDDSLFETAFTQANLPGAVGLIVDREGTRYARGLGVADIETGAAMGPETLCQIASMTKALVSVAAMQLVEAGRLSLDAPIGTVLPELADAQVLTGFDEGGQPQTRAAKHPPTLRHLLTHTAGFGYFFVHPEVLQYYGAVGMPAPGSRDSIRMPLLFDPGERWEYSVATDWAGLAVEAASGQRLGDYMAEHILAPLGMKDTAFRDALPAAAARVHVRLPEGGFQAQSTYLGGGEFDSGGGGLTGTAADYARFVRMMLGGGALDGVRVLRAETVAEMARNQIAPLRAGYTGSSLPHLAPPFDFLPDQHSGWGLGFLINPETGPNGRSPGSQAYSSASFPRSPTPARWPRSRRWSGWPTPDRADLRRSSPATARPSRAT
jgi:methyl acetate hydrolase